MKSGYTLLEAIIYIAILAGLSVLFINLLFTMVRAYTQFQLERNLTSSAALGLERLVRETRQATSANSLASTFNTNPGKLVLNTVDSGGLPTTVEFFLTGSTLMVKAGSGQAASTTAKNVNVDNLIFRQISTVNSSAIKIEMTLTAHRGATARTGKFYSTAVLRGSY
ncbi:MAG: hypothetical protein HYT46_00385 [Candidatus Vogelbacteria bacterium]|nr:hypothetical protein [Candidatus Vogelbacteria bacterium]